jgi:hypothetical protein
METTRVNPASGSRVAMRMVRRVARRTWFHIRAMVLGFEIRHALPII